MNVEIKNIQTTRIPEPSQESEIQTPLIRTGVAAVGDQLEAAKAQPLIAEILQGTVGSATGPQQEVACDPIPLPEPAVLPESLPEPMNLLSRVADLPGPMPEPADLLARVATPVESEELLGRVAISHEDSELLGRVAVPAEEPLEKRSDALHRRRIK